MTPSQNTPAIFSNPDLFSGNLRVIMQGDDPWFVAKDVCLALGYNVKSTGEVNVTNATRHLLPDEFTTARISTGRGGAATIISESGLYKLIMRSNKPVAKAFQDWVTREVLPSIRKTGGYIVARPDESPEVILARAVLVAQDTIERMKAKLKEEQEARCRAEASAREVSEYNHKLSAQVRDKEEVITENLRYVTADEWRALNHLYLKHGDKVRLGLRATQLHRELLGEVPAKQRRIIQTAKGERETFPNVYPTLILNRAAKALGLPINMKVA